MKIHRTTPPVWVCLICVPAALAAAPFVADHADDKVTVRRDGRVVLEHVAGSDFRPYLHPITPLDGKGVLTEFSPSHHKHQTGLYWGFTRLNGRDFFTHPGEGRFKRKSVELLPKEEGVGWTLVYEWLDEAGAPVLTEKQVWRIGEADGHYWLDLTWSGTAHGDVTISKYQYGGMFLRMPWKPGVEGYAVNSRGARNDAAEGQRAEWVDVGMAIDGRDDWGHIVLMDHPANPGYPTPWRVDSQLGVGPCLAPLGDWKIPDAQTTTFRHRILIYTGPTDRNLVDAVWRDYTKDAPIGDADQPDKKCDPTTTPSDARASTPGMTCDRVSDCTPSIRSVYSSCFT